MTVREERGYTWSMKTNQVYPTDLTDRKSGLYQRTDPSCKARRATAHAGDASGHQWYVVRCRQWLSMADVTPRVSSLAKCLYLLPAMARCWNRASARLHACRPGSE